MEERTLQVLHIQMQAVTRSAEEYAHILSSVTKTIGQMAEAAMKASSGKRNGTFRRMTMAHWCGYSLPTCGWWCTIASTRPYRGASMQFGSVSSCDGRSIRTSWSAISIGWKSSNLSLWASLDWIVIFRPTLDSFVLARPTHLPYLCSRIREIGFGYIYIDILNTPHFFESGVKRNAFLII